MIPVRFDPSSRYAPQLSQIQQLCGPDFTLVEAESAQFEFYGPFPVSGRQRLLRTWRRLRYSKPIRIFWTGENARPDFERFDWCVTFDHDDIVQHPRHLRRPVCPLEPVLLKPWTTSSRSSENLKFCNFLYSQPGRIRERFFDLLSGYKPVDAPGARKNNMLALAKHENPLKARQSQNWFEERLDFLKAYKFTIAFENSSYPGYVTEKLWHTLLSGSIPIYWGDPVVARDFNSQCFINVHDFPSLEAVVEWVRKVDSSDELYQSYFREAAVVNPEALASTWKNYERTVRAILTGR